MYLDLQEANDELIRFFNNIDYGPFYNDVGLILENAVAQQFESQGTYFNKTPWAPLAASTLKDRKRKGFDLSSILRRSSGDAGLLGSILSSTSIDGSTVTIGTNKHYAPYLQFGTSKMPARPFLPSVENGLPAVVFKEIEDTLKAFMLNAMK
jgi:phage gpG-like protein